MKLFGIILLFLLAVQANGQPTSEAILAQNRAMEQAYNSGALAEIASFYTRDAQIIGPKTMVEGRYSIVSYWKNLEGRNVDWKLENTKLMLFESTAIQQGISYLKFRHEERIVESVVRFTLLWVKEDGQWKIKIDHYTPL